MDNLRAATSFGQDGCQSLRFGDMSDSESWPFANLLTLSERVGPQAPLGMLYEVGRLAVKMQVSGQRRHQHVSGCTFDLVPPA